MSDCKSAYKDILEAIVHSKDYILIEEPLDIVFKARLYDTDEIKEWRFSREEWTAFVLENDEIIEYGPNQRIVINHVEQAYKNAIEMRKIVNKGEL